MTTIELYTIAFNNYWDIFGKFFIKQYNSLNTKPDRMVVYSDKPITDKPDEFENIIVDENYYSKLIEENHGYKNGIYRQAAVDNAKCEWLACIDIDDPFFTNFLDFDFGELNQYNIISRSLLTENKRSKISVKYQKTDHIIYASDIFKNLKDADDYFKNDRAKWVYASSCIIKSEIVKEIGYLKNGAHIGAEDHNFFVNFIDKGYYTKTFLHNKPTLLYKQYNDSASKQKLLAMKNLNYFNKVKNRRKKL